MSAGRCRHCNARISVQYPIIEFAGAGILVAVVTQIGLSTECALIATYILLMLAIAVIDWRHLMIPDALVLTGLALGIILIAAVDIDLLAGRIGSGVASFGGMYLVRSAGDYIYRKPTMGFGDVKLAAVIGLFLGWEHFLLSLWLGAILGTGYIFAARCVPTISRSICSIAASRPLAFGSRLPFGTFLAVSSTMTLLCSAQVDHLLKIWLTSVQ